MSAALCLDSARLNAKELVQPLRDSLPPLYKKLLVVLHAQHARVGRDALRCERPRAALLEDTWKVLAWALVADLAVGLSTNEGQVGDIISLASRVATLQDGLREHVMELQPMLCPSMSKSDRKV